MSQACPQLLRGVPSPDARQNQPAVPGKRPLRAQLRHENAARPLPGRRRCSGDDAARVAAQRRAQRGERIRARLADPGRAQHRDGQDPDAPVAADRGGRGDRARWRARGPRGCGRERAARPAGTFPAQPRSARSSSKRCTSMAAPPGKRRSDWEFPTAPCSPVRDHALRILRRELGATRSKSPSKSSSKSPSGGPPE